MVGIATALVLGACTSTNVHDTSRAKNQACVNCHLAAYDNVKSPPHAGVVDDAGNPSFPTDQCGDCHVTTAWVPAKGGGHAGSIETAFPISTGSHANAAIGCTDCHKPSLGADNTSGANCDCIHCHIGAHVTPSIDDTHVACINDGTCSAYTPSGSSAPNYCLGCHPSG